MCNVGSAEETRGWEAEVSWIGRDRGRCISSRRVDLVAVYLTHLSTLVCMDQ